MISDKTTKKILITGGAGFIGSHFIRHILQKYPHYQIINLDKLTYCGNLENLKDIQTNPRYAFVQGDIADASVVNSIVEKNVDAIVNFAAESHVDRSILNPTAFLHTSVQGTYTLLESAKKYGVGRFLQISTDEVYGSRETGSFKETDALNPSSPYSAAKAAADLLALSYFTTYHLPAIITRSANNFGSHQYPEKLIPLFITNLLENKKIPLYGDGLNTRDWLYVQDNCQAIDLVLHKGENGNIYNIGSNQEKSNLDITQTILAALASDKNQIQYVQDRPGHDRRYSLDCSKIRQEIGWQPEYDFNQALQATIDWYRHNEAWWKKIKSGEYATYYKTQYQTQ